MLDTISQINSGLEHISSLSLKQEDSQKTKELEQLLNESKKAFMQVSKENRAQRNELNELKKEFIKLIPNPTPTQILNEQVSDS